ncbi:alpha/beta hydrolase family protein [Methylorubrum extorquens]
MATSMLQEYYDISRWMYGFPTVSDQVTPPNGYSILADSGLTVSGFHGTALITDEADPKVIIGFEGTDVSGFEERPLFLLAQVEADLYLYRGVVPQALRDARDFTQQVLAVTDARNIPRDDIAITGHSLGAGEAAYASAWHALDGVTFAAPGLPPGSIPSTARTPTTLELQNYVEYGDPVANYSSTPENYEGAFLFNPGVSRYGEPIYIGDQRARFVLEAAGDLYGLSNSDAKAAALVAFGLLADEYHPLTKYGADLGLKTNSPPGPVSSLDATQIRLLYDDIADRNILVSDAYYQIMNPDVFASSMDAEEHYSQYGWKEGRDPNAFFSTTGYLAANPDVAKAGINPLAHFDQFGSKEGRDPSVLFDSELYLTRNPDVRAAGFDPLTHFLAFGRGEGREAFAAIGMAEDIGRVRGFDAEYYLLSNIDVAEAALANGGDNFAYAYQHYESYGWHEGRNPNSVFDTNGYLATYKDVATADINPLSHYDQYGFREGRDPSANFDTSTYLQVYGDVAQAGVNPMTHYLQYGVYEGRLGFADGTFGAGGVG